MMKVGDAMNRRNATTLTEVLIAIFIMGIGLMAILALFPMGALQMAQAIKDQRAAEAAANAAALARIIWKQACDADETFLGPTSSSGRAPFRENTTARQYPRCVQRFLMAMDDPNFNDQAGSLPNNTSYPPPPSVAIPPGPAGVPAGFILTPAPGTAGVNQYTDMRPMPLIGPQANQSSYPVLVDMYGWVNQADPNRKLWVGHGAAPLPQQTTSGNKIGLIPRRPLFVRNPAQLVVTPPSDWLVLGLQAPVAGVLRIHRQFSLIDDMAFNFDGTPDLDNDPNTPDTSSAATASVQRVGRYSWAYLFRRPRNKDFRTEVDVQVVVYSGRSIDVPTDEIAYPAIGTWDSRFVRLQYGGSLPKPALKRGSWVLDATMFNSVGDPDPQGRFYRVVNVEDGAANEVNIELQTPLPPSGPNGTQRVFIVMNNVVEVFQIGYLSPTTPPRNILDDHEY